MWPMLAKVVCLFKHHDPRRAGPLGGFRCGRCGKVGGDLHDLGFIGESYVNPVRRKFSREHGGSIERVQDKWRDS